MPSVPNRRGQGTAIRALRASPVARYGLAIAVAVASILLRLSLDPVWGTTLPYITLFPAIMVSAWLGGFWPGLVTTAISATAAEYFWIEPSRSWRVAEPSEWLGLFVFVAVGAVISALNEAWRRGTAAIAQSEERLGVTLASIGDAVITTDDHGRVTRLNTVAQGLIGCSAAEAIGRPLHDVLVIINEQTRQPAENPVDRVLRDGVISGLANHTLLISKDGREIPIDDSAAPIRGDDGHMSGVVMVFRDISDRRRAEREQARLLERERSAREETERVRREVQTAVEQLRAALQAGRMGTWHYTIATGDVKWSPGLEAIHGYAPGTFPGTFEAFRNEIHPADRDHVLRAIGSAIDQRRDHHVEYRIVRPDGAVRCVEGRGQLFCDSEDRPERMVGVCVDVTERKETEERLLVREQEARAEIERASRLKDEFLAVLSHELRTPLNAVLGYAHLLGSGALPAERSAHALEAIQRNAHAQARLVESLLDLSRIMAGKLELDRERLDLSGVVNAAVDVIRPEADGKEITIDVEMPSSGISLVGDGGRLQQVFWNLLSNAVKFTPRRGQVGIQVVLQDSQVRIQVSDNGQGITPEFLPYIFERFKQAESHKGRSPAGLGLGLALVREMVHAHGGTVVAESAGEGHGSTFTVMLPSAAGTVAPEPTDAGATPMDLIESLAPIDILVVDDDGDVRELLALLLESRGATVRTVASAHEAVEAITQRRPRVLLADLRMPDEDGYSLMRRLRAREHEERQERLPAIAVTAYAGSRDREQALAAGYDWHVAKPVDPGELARAIVRVARVENM